MKSAIFVLACVLAGTMVTVQSSEAPAPVQVQKQPVFLLCPCRTKFSSWSLFLEVDAKDHSKVLRLGLEELPGKNSKDAPYETVLAAQNDAKSERKLVAVLEAADFGKKELRVEDHDALHVTVELADDGTYHLFLSLRVGASDRFVIGGKNRKKNDVLFRFSTLSKTWGAQVTALTGADGEKLVLSKGVSISGLLFPLLDTGIYTLLGVVNGSEIVTLLDRGGMSE